MTGLRSARAVYSHLGKPARCGRCLDLAARLIEEVHASGQHAHTVLPETAD